ncbi:hypothetical protein IAQ61_001639 [Plenodomus lingam]|uniref:Uncharacterized protein n=1 Tax=Leptosphaeria maculans (strain JN3 / isolate v23.1.3 / race Av1-4-5-6-7-8) TaxID=985895 RepID=M1ZIL5_LEPMJ|nr:hypothetical protein IAQ61_001639 [Plenodomus lingam]CCT61082.1 predicted protein [Plenodomus lingam JN3]
MVSLRERMRKLSSRALNKFKSSENSPTSRQIPLAPVAEQAACRLTLPKDPKLVQRNLHDEAPLYLPSPAASREEVQYFIYAVLTTRVFGCAKACPQWVLEACWNCHKTGEEFLDMTDAEVMALCPVRSRLYAFADADQKRWNIQQFPSPHARELIGKAVLAVLKDRRKSQSSKKNQIQRHWDAEGFCNWLNRGLRNDSHSDPPLSPDWNGAGYGSTGAARTVQSRFSSESSYAPDQKRGSGQSSACTKSTGATTVLEDSAGHHDRDRVSNILPAFSSTAARLSNMRRAGSLRVRGSAPVLRTKEVFRPASMRDRPKHISQLYANQPEPEPPIIKEPKIRKPAPSLGVEIPNGHISIDFGLPLFPQSFLANNDVALVHRAEAYLSGSPTISSPSPHCPPKPRNSQLPQQQTSAPTQTHRACLLPDLTHAGSIPSLATMRPSIGVKIAQSQIASTQHAPETAVQYAHTGVSAPKTAQPSLTCMPSPVRNFDTTATRQWPPHRMIVKSTSETALNSVSLAAQDNGIRNVAASTDVAGGPSPIVAELPVVNTTSR